VLLVDDEEPFVKNMARILKVRGFDVSTALDG
jgi:ActR/RegA family two-component response regulator